MKHIDEESIEKAFQLFESGDIFHLIIIIIEIEKSYFYK